MLQNIQLSSWRFAQAFATVFLLCVLSNVASAQGIPSTLGWYEIPNTKLRTVCAAENGFSQVWGNTGCAAITLAWSGGTFDPKGNRLLIWGGGHGDYYGNEIYALDLDNLSINRLTDPGLPPASSCTNSIAGGTQPNSRHSYGGVGYIASADRLWIAAGSLACGSGSSPTNNGDIWTYNLAGSPTVNQWQSMNPAIVGGAPGNLCGSSCFGWTAQYDPNKRLLFFKDIYYLYTYDFASNTVTRVSNRLDANLYTSAVIDTDRRLYIEIGSGKVNSFDISGNAPHPGVSRTTSGATAIVNAGSPGLAYDPVQKRVVAWDGGNTVYLLDTGTWTWSTVTYSGGPAKVGSQGTFGRFAYSPASNVFVSCNSVDANCYTLRLTAGGSTSTPTPAPTVNITAAPTSISSGSSSTLSWSSTNTTSCSASGGWSGSKATSGSQSTGNLTANTTFTLTCTGAGGSTSQSASVSIASATTPPTTVTGSPTLLVKFGAPGQNNFGLTGWSTVIKDIYTDYRNVGPGGTTIVVGSNPVYNYQGVTGNARTFVAGEKIRVTWYNNSASPVSFTPNISFTSASRYSAAGGWYPMSTTTVPARGSATSDYTFTSASAGSFSIVNVNVNYENNQVVVADKIELLPVGSSASPSFDFSLSNGGNKSVAQGQSVSTSVSATLVSGTAQSVNFSMVGLPSGASATLALTGCTPTCSTNITVTTLASTVAASYPITMTATGGGVTRTTSFSLTVTTSTSTPPPSQSPSADADFQTRCSAPGVLKCVGFDNTTSDIVQNVNLFPDGSGVFRAGLDTSVKTSGNGSLRFTLPPPPHAGANIAGRWSPDTTRVAGALTQTFSQNSTFFVQYRFRLSPDMLTNTWDSSWKVSLFHMNNLSCAGIELTLVNRNMSGVAEIYDRCGAGVVGTGNTHPPSPPYNIQTNTWPNCAYPNFNSSNCYTYAANEWITMYFRIDIGTWDQPNSRVQAWVATESVPSYRQWLDTGPTYKLTCNSDPCTQSPGSTQGYNNITLTPYMTALSSSSGKPGVTSYMWFDELIVSKQAIAAPGTDAAPAATPVAPTGLTLK